MLETAYTLTEHLHLNEFCLPNNSPCRPIYIYSNMLLLFQNTYFWVADIKFRPWHMLGKQSTTEPQSHPNNFFFLFGGTGV
jgi:hypothetical protein